MIPCLADLSRREKFLWLFFSVTCFQLVTKIPYLSVIPGERTKVFSGLLCALTFFTLLIVKQQKLRISTEWTICVVLSLLCLFSGLGSSSPSSSLWRGATLIFSAVGGFWCGRLMLDTRYCRIFFGRFCLFLLTLLLLFGVAGFIFDGKVLYFAGVHKHIFNGLILLLSFGPLQLLFGGRRWMVVTGILYLLASYYVISLSFDPMIWFPPLLLLGGIIVSMRIKKRIIIPVLLVFIVVGLFQKYQLPEYFLNKGSISTWVRVENVFFSWHIAKKKPLLGIGLVAPRLAYLDDYEIVYPYVTKEQFSAVIPDENRSSENQIFTFLCDLGMPFLLIYSSSMLFLYLRLCKHAWRDKKRGEDRSIILWIPITAALLHFQFFDGLLHPQISWFFHILIGLISVNKTEPNLKKLQK